MAELRERRALTLRELSEMSGVAADTINQIELGHRKARPSTLRKLAKALEVDVRELFEEPVAAGKAEAPGLVDWLLAHPTPIEELSDQDRREIERVLAGGKPRAYFVDSALAEAATTAADAWLGQVTDSDLDLDSAFALVQKASDLEDTLSVLIGDAESWRNLSGATKGEITRAMKVLEDVIAQYRARLDEELKRPETPPAQLAEFRRRREELNDLRAHRSA